ncbi:MAG: hypothetical protein QXI85_00470 [Desulfurococcaceae archaeon]
MSKSTKMFLILPIVQVFAVAFTVYSTSYSILAASLAVYVAIVATTSIHVDKYFTKKEATALLLLLSIATCVGALLGYIASRNTYSAVVMLSIALASTTYAVTATKIREVSS